MKEKLERKIQKEVADLPKNIWKELDMLFYTNIIRVILDKPEGTSSSEILMLWKQLNKQHTKSMCKMLNNYCDLVNNHLDENFSKILDEMNDIWGNDDDENS